MQIRSLENLSQSLKDRLAFIEFRLWFLGDVSRKDLMDRFGIAPAVATRDLSAYREVAPDNIDFDGSRKIYVTGSGFAPLFDHPVERVLSTLSKGFGDGTNDRTSGYLPCELPLRLNKPSLSVLAVVSRAIHQQKFIRVKYHSLNKGPSEREIAPFALVDSGLRWHTRAYDRKSKEFRDLVLSRIEDPILIETSSIAPFEKADQDDQWTRMLTLVLAPHPDQERPEIVARDFGMKENAISIRTRAALAGYILQLWNVDCSVDHHLAPSIYRLWLQDPLVLHQVNSAVLAPGYST